ncbi:unnamed protein product [Angiostrongylus costaricensis]|uniref:ZP domain-containing protein n=1 Tax=Angiostrongylus costaricensis TaxID=334426 RepID=A0A158PIA0_ANGCS|nr:unnamed protein product [Angiostrongylus costaricensis]
MPSRMKFQMFQNGSREFSAHLEIGFHPLVITSSDRLFSVKCIDNSHSPVTTLAERFSTCSHSVRLTSRWESSTVFHVGDAVIHEWKFLEAQKYQTFLTSCNAVSSSGQVLHLVDENGCIVDSELIGEIVYNSFIPKVFARARMFKLMNSEKYRIKCNIQICGSDSVCKNRTFVSSLLYYIHFVFRLHTVSCQQKFKSLPQPFRFANFRDWLLDDRTINESDIHHERQLGCSNATIIASHRNCSWSGIEHLLVVWSFTSLLLWIIMIAVCFYRQTNKPTWAEFRERELQRMTQARVIQHDHPWIHTDAFEETQNRKKNHFL